MVLVAKITGTGLANTGLIGTGVVSAGLYINKNFYATSPDPNSNPDTDPHTSSESAEESSLKKEEKQEIVDAMRKYDEGRHTKRPEFNNPGYPKYEGVTQAARTQEEYQEILDKFGDKYGIQPELKEHDEKCKEHIVDEWKVKHPEIPSSEIEKYVDKKQDTQYGTYEYSDAPVDEGLNKKEAEWRQDVYYASMEHRSKRKLPNESDGSLPRKRVDENDPFGDSDTASTPEARVSPPADWWEKKVEESLVRQDLNLYGDFDNKLQSQLYDVSSDSDKEKEDNNPNNEDNNPNNEDNNSKRSLSEDNCTAEGSSKRQKLDNNDKQSPIDYVIEKQSTEMSDITESDGGD